MGKLPETLVFRLLKQSEELLVGIHFPLSFPAIAFWEVKDK